MTKLEFAQAARKHLIGLASQMTNKDLIAACDVVLHHPKFVTSIGGTTHHAYEGGLAVHTAEVVQISRSMMLTLAPARSLDVITTAAIFHDFMKIRDYAGHGHTPYRHLVRHVAGSHAEFMKAIDGKKVHEDISLQIEHAILAHHGKYEHGSPVLPQTMEGYVLHYADNLSKHFGDGRK